MIFLFNYCDSNRYFSTSWLSLKQFVYLISLNASINRYKLITLSFLYIICFERASSYKLKIRSSFSVEILSTISFKSSVNWSKGLDKNALYFSGWPLSFLISLASSYYLFSPIYLAYNNFSMEQMIILYEIGGVYDFMSSR